MHRALFVAVIVVLSACAASDATDSTDSTIPPTTADPPLRGEEVSLNHVFDGDSIEVQLADGTSAEVRLIGINAPEGDECHGDAARNALESLLDGSVLTLVTDGEERDQFERLLRYVYSDGVNANLEMVAGGDALALQSGHRLETTFVDAAAAATASGSGMWSRSACGNTGRIPDIGIARYEFDPAGRDSDNPNNEWVVVANRDSDPVTLAEWILRDESTQHRFVFSDGFQLNPGDEVKIHSGCGTATTTDLYWCARDPVWSNGGDTIILQLPDGTIAAWEQYPGEF